MNPLRSMVGFALLIAAVPARPATYTVRVDRESPQTVQVRGTFTLEADTIGLYVTSSPQLDDGQAAFVRNLDVRTPDGEPIDTEYAGQGDWTLRGVTAGDPIELQYDIALEHELYDWGPGIDEVAYRQDDGLFFTGYSLFILPGLSSSEAVTVRFELPDGWRASTPWDRATPDGKTFRAASPYDLGRNCLFLGRHLEESITLDEFTFTLALGGDLAGKKQLFVDTMEPLLPAYRELFGGMPSATRYLVVINSGDRSDGGAFAGSYSMLIRGDVTLASRAVWGHGIAHELAHFWNGHTLVPASESDEEWFKEGFTDYVTLIQLSRSGLDSWGVTSRKLENMARRYILARRLMGLEDSLRSAGADKHRKRFLVYGGGSLVALALDVRLRQATDNSAGIDELLQAMFREFGTTREPYEFDDIVRLAGEISGRDESDFFARFVDGNETLDIGPVFEGLGLSLTTMVDEFYLAEREDATAAERAIARAILGHSVGPSTPTAATP